MDRGIIQEGEIRQLPIKVMIDLGAYMLAFNRNISEQLGLKKVDEKLAEMADGRKVKLDVVGPVEIRFENRKSITTAMILPGDAEALLGAIPMEDMDVIIDPLDQKMKVHPDRPFMPKMSLKKVHA